MYYLKVISLIGCPYSEKALKLIKNYNINNKITYIDYNEKDKYITDDIQTFPQIYLMKEHMNGHKLIGGCSDLEECIILLTSNIDEKSYNENIKKIMNKYNWNKRIALRFANLINFSNN
jgi:glutaredoxin